MSIYTNGYWSGGFTFIGTTSLRRPSITLPNPYREGIQIYPWIANEAEYSREMALLLRPFEPLTYNKALSSIKSYSDSRSSNAGMLSGKTIPCTFKELLQCPPPPMPNEAQIKRFLTYTAFMNWFAYVDTISTDSKGGAPLNKVFACPLGNCQEATAQWMFHRLKTGNSTGVKYIYPALFRQKLKDPAFLAPTFPGAGGAIKNTPKPKNPTTPVKGKQATGKKSLTPLKGKK